MHNPIVPWARPARWAVLAYTVVVALCGGTFVFVEGAAGSFATLMIGIVAVAAACLLGGLAWMGVAVYEHHAINARQLEHVQLRLEHLARAVAGEAFGLESFAGEDLFMIDDVSRHEVPQLTGEWSESWADELTGLTFLPSPIKADEDDDAASNMHALRRQFGAYLRAERYADALQAGERIEELAPDSVMAEDFRTLRPLLERRLRRLSATTNSHAQ